MSAHLPGRIEADVAIVGSGFSGTLTAMALRRLGRSVVLLERGRHPRFAIGESSTPLANLLLEQLCDEYGLQAVRPLSKMGTWRQAYPQVACGLKRGFSFFHHTPGEPFADDERRRRQLLVAASPHDEVSDTHWYRPELDAFLVGQAEASGATYLDEIDITSVAEHGDRVTIEARRGGSPLLVEAGFVVDASGPRGFLHRALGFDEPPLRWLPATRTLYAHFRHVEVWRDVWAGDREEPPFPVDAAALHHVFPGGWIWVLRFNNGITSAGVAATEALASEIRLEEGQPAWTRLLDRLPSIREQFARAVPVTPFMYAPRLAFRTRHVTGPRWAMLPSAAGVIDPLLSTGFPLTLLGVRRLVRILDRHWSGNGLAAALRAYAQATERELDATERLVAALYAAMDDFELFKRLSLLYFAAASFAEAARRLGRETRAPGFLLCEDPVFATELGECTDLARSRPAGAVRDGLLARIDRAIEPWDVAGLGDRSRRDWYPVLATDLVTGASKLEASQAEVAVLLDRCWGRTGVRPGSNLGLTPV
jgi:FADH2 O2-dependent halogenase